MGDIRIRCNIVSKGEEEDLHARKFKAVHDFNYVRGNNTEIFSDNRDLRKSLKQDSKNPLPVL